MSKMIAFFNQPDFEKKLEIKLPTPDQITSSILYCKKYDIPFWDKYGTSKMDSFVARNILAEMYGLTVVDGLVLVKLLETPTPS